MSCTCNASEGLALASATPNSTAENYCCAPNAYPPTAATYTTCGCDARTTTANKYYRFID